MGPGADAEQDGVEQDGAHRRLKGSPSSTWDWFDHGRNHAEVELGGQVSASASPVRTPLMTRFIPLRGNDPTKSTRTGTL